MDVDFRIIPAVPLKIMKKPPSDQPGCIEENCIKCNQPIWVSEQKRNLRKQFESKNENYLLACWECIKKLMGEEKNNELVFVNMNSLKPEEILTIEKLQSYQPNTIFLQGILTDNPDGINLSNTENKVRWIAVRGDIPDWTIYAQNPNYGELQWDIINILKQGDKITNPYNIRKLVPCDDEAFKRYRY